MEVSLELVATTEKLLPEFNKVKKATTDLGTSAKDTGAVIDQAFKKGEQSASKMDKSIFKNIHSYEQLETAINDTITNGIAKFIVATEQAEKKTKNATKSGEEGFKSFKTRILEATKEVGILQEKFKAGLISEQELKTAKQGLADLKEEFSDFQQEIDSLNPEAKFTAVAQLATGIAGGFAAAQGAMALFGSESEDVNKALLKVNAALAFSQGINQVLGLGDAWKNFRQVLGLTTAAKIKDTVVTEANTIVQTEAAVAAGVQAGAVTSVAVAETGATTATVAWGLAMKALPIIAIITGVVALIGLISSFGDETEDLQKQVDAMARSTDRFNSLTDKLRNISKNRQSEIKDEIDLMKIQGASEADIAAKREQLKNEVLRGYQEEVNGNVERINQLIALQAKLEAALADDPTQENFDNVNKNSDLIDSLRDRNKAILVEAKSFGRQLTNEEASEAAQRLEKRKQLNEELLQADKSYHEAVLQLERQVLNSQGEQAIGIERLRIQKQQADAELSATRAALIEKGQAQEKAEAAAQGRKERVFRLSLEQEEQFNTLNLLLLQKYNKDVEALKLEQRSIELDFIKNTNEKAIEEFNISFAKRALKYKEAGKTELQIEAIKNEELAKLKAKLGTDALSMEEKIQIAIINSRERGKESELEFERQKAIDILKIQLEAAKQKLALNLSLFQAGDSSAERQAAIADLDALITDLKGRITKAQNELSSGQKKLSLAKLLGITGSDGKSLTAEEEQQFNDAAASIVGSVVSIFQAALEQQALLNQQAIDNNQDYIDSLNDRISQTQQALNKEEEAQKKGYANNVDAKKKEIAQLNAEKQKAIEEDKKLQKERRKIAQEQAIIDAIVQGSQLLSAGATLFAKGAFSGTVGIITAIATIAAMVAAFVGLKTKIAQATKFESGGTIGGRRHSQGGHKYVSQDGSGKVLELEDGEEVINRKAAQRHRKLLMSINSGELDHLTGKSLHQLLSGTGVILREGVESKIAQQSVQLHSAEIKHTMSIRLNGVEDRLDKLNNEVAGVREHLVSLPQTITMPDGTRKITEKTGDVEMVTIIHKT